jgi:acyl transferase domain-containing protein
MKPIVWMFSGLGSQRYNMGEGLLREDPVFRQTMERCDEIVHTYGLKLPLAAHSYP